MDVSVDRIARPWGSRTPYGRHEPWPVRVDTYLEAGVDPGLVQRWVQTASLLHSDGDIFLRGAKHLWCIGEKKVR